MTQRLLCHYALTGDGWMHNAIIEIHDGRLSHIMSLDDTTSEPHHTRFVSGLLTGPWHHGVSHNVGMHIGSPIDTLVTPLATNEPAHLLLWQHIDWKDKTINSNTYFSVIDDTMAHILR